MLGVCLYVYIVKMWLCVRALEQSDFAYKVSSQPQFRPSTSALQRLTSANCNFLVYYIFTQLGVSEPRPEVEMLERRSHAHQCGIQFSMLCDSLDFVTCSSWACRLASLVCVYDSTLYKQTIHFTYRYRVVNFRRAII